MLFTIKSTKFFAIPVEMKMKNKSIIKAARNPNFSPAIAPLWLESKVNETSEKEVYHKKAD